MPLFAALFSALFSALGVFLAKLFAARLAMRLIGVAALTAMGSAMLTAFNGWISPLVAVAFSTQYGQFIGLAFPPIAGTVLTVYFTAWIAVQTYKMQTRAVALTAGM